MTRAVVAAAAAASAAAAAMVYLFHFELPVDEATWTCVATAYRSYEKHLTLSEVDAPASAVVRPLCVRDDGGPVTFLSFYHVNTTKGNADRRRRPRSSDFLLFFLEKKAYTLANEFSTHTVISDLF